MVRRTRIEIVGGLYHIVAVGNQKRYIFLKEEDYLDYLDNLYYYRKKLDFKVFAYTLMKDHIHLLLEQGETPLHKVMQRIQQRFTQRYNWRKKRCGHLFQGRYWARLCQKESYLFELLRYIHLNPYRKKLVKNLLQYRWSSHSYYWYGKSHKWLAVDEGLSYLGNKRKGAVELYRQIILDGIGEKEKIGDINNGEILGDEQFKRKINKQIKKKHTVRRKTIDEIIAEICADKRISPEILFSKSKNRFLVQARKEFIIRGALETESNQIELARLTGYGEAWVSMILADKFSGTGN